MARNVVEPTVEEDGGERHPAWVLIGASRVQSHPGTALFDSDLLHQHYVVVTLRRAERKRDLNHDYKYGREEIIEVAMSEAQWASFVSSMNTGDGVPATLLWDRTRDDPEVPGVPYEPRLQVSMDEVHAAAHRAWAEVQEAFEAVKAKPTKANLWTLEIALRNTTPNIDFAAEKLSEHAENVVQRSRADIEAFVVSKARQLGIDPAELDSPLALESGEA